MAGPESIEQLGLLNKISKDDVSAISKVTAAHQARMPNWAELGGSGQIDSSWAPILSRFDNSENNRLILKSDVAAISVLFAAIDSIVKDSNAILYLTGVAIGACKAETPLWDKLAKHVEPSTQMTGHMACCKSLERGWDDPAVNESLAYLLTALQSHNPTLKDVLSVAKTLMDPRAITMGAAGRLAALTNILMDDSIRVDLCKSSTFRSFLVQGLTSKDLEQMYYATLCFWLLSFNESVRGEGGPLQENGALLDSFVDMITSCKREKVVRAACHAIKNLIQSEWIFEIFSRRKLDHTLSLLEYEKWRDKDLYDAIQENTHIFFSKSHQYSSFSRYMKELINGKFTPGPLHTEKFWIENVRCFEDNEFSAITKLTALLHSEDITTISLACFDLGEFSRLYPTGKRIVLKVGAKDKIVDLMNHPNKEVAREALLSTQKMMLDDWRKLGSEAQEKHLR